MIALDEINLSAQTASGENPAATSLNNLLTRHQYLAIADLSRRLDLDPDALSLRRFGLPYDHLSKAGADDILSILCEWLNGV